MAAPTCLTCTKSADQEASLTVCHHGNAQKALSTHFWFNEIEINNGVLCQLCWQKIDDFHQFYREIERTHLDDPAKISTQFVEVKDELQETPAEPECIVDAIEKDSSIKSESIDKNVDNKKHDKDKLSSSDDESVRTENDDPDPMEDVPQEKYDPKTTARPLQKLRKVIEDDEFISQHINLTCDTCSEKCNTFQELQRHSMMQHEKLATVFCCDMRFARRFRLMEHIQFHINPKKFQCDICTKLFPNNEGLRRHRDKMHTAEKDKTFQCSICPKTFSRKTYLHTHEKYHRKRNHVETEHADEKPAEVPEQKDSSDDESSQNDDNDPDYDERDSEVKVTKTANSKRKKTTKTLRRSVQTMQKTIKDEQFISENINLECDTCSLKHNTFQELQNHSIKEHERHAFVFCCGQKFSRRPRLIDHIQFHLNPTQFQCDICSKQFPHSEGLKRHKANLHSQEEDKTFQCTMCPKTFSRKRFLNIHEKYHRKLNEKKWHCTTCDRYFTYESKLQEHLIVHTDEFKYVCHVCAKGYQIWTSYTSHMKIHSDDPKQDKTKGERIQCTECNTWVYKRGYRKHMLRHSGSQTCDHCGQECKSEMALRYHKAQHRKQDLTCSVCGKTFKRALILKEHMAAHTGDRLYHCDFCEKTFNSNANRASHRKKMHPKEWLEDKIKKNPNLSLEHGILQQFC